MDLATHVVIFEELHEREEWDGILFVVDARGGHALRIDVVCERLVADLQRRLISRSTGTCRGRNGAGAYPGRTISDGAHGHVGREVQREVDGVQERKRGTFGIEARGDERVRGRNCKERRRSSVMGLTKGRPDNSNLLCRVQSKTLFHSGDDVWGRPNKC